MYAANYGEETSSESSFFPVLILVNTLEET